MSFTFPADYRYVVAALAVPPLINTYLFFTVNNLRIRSKVKLPLLFASPEDAEKDPLKYEFNCTQKASMNYQEHLPPFTLAAAVAGVSFPKFAATLVLGWTAFRFAYLRGYAASGPKGRAIGTYGANVIQLVTFISAVVSGVLLIKN